MVTEPRPCRIQRKIIKHHNILYIDILNIALMQVFEIQYILLVFTPTRIVPIIIEYDDHKYNL